MAGNVGTIYKERDGNITLVKNKTVAFIGYGNQGRSQALNLRDSGISVIVGNREDEYRDRIKKDGFPLFHINEAAAKGDVIFILLPDEDMPEAYELHIEPNLRAGQTLVFASGYNIAFNLIKPRANVDVVMIAPRMIGIGVRERFLSGEGFFSFIGVHQDTSGNALQTALALAGAMGALKGAVDVTFKEEAMLDLFNEQAFGPAFGRVLLDAIDVLVSNGLPTAAVLIEMYMSEEMAYTYRKMAQVGVVKQMEFHSHTSQYGAMSRGIRYAKLGIKKLMQKSFNEIESGQFAKEWQSKSAKLKFKAIKHFAARQKINQIEQEVRDALGLESREIDTAPEEIEEIMKSPELKKEIDKIKDLFEL